MVPGAVGDARRAKVRAKSRVTPQSGGAPLVAPPGGTAAVPRAAAAASPLARAREIAIWAARDRTGDRGCAGDRATRRSSFVAISAAAADSRAAAADVACWPRKPVAAAAAFACRACSARSCGDRSE